MIFFASSYIAGTNGYSNGIVPMLRAYDATARYVDQGGNKRPGAFAVYLEPWHVDAFCYGHLNKTMILIGWKDSMKRVEANGNWSLFCPNEAPDMHEVYGEEFEALYEKYEREGRAHKTIPAKKLWYAILEAQIETGGPFMTYKDHANRMSASQLMSAVHLPFLCRQV